MGVTDLYVAEYMGMAEYQLVVECVGHVGYVEAALLVGNLRVEQNMKQDVAEFLFYIGGVVVGKGLSQLVDFFDRVRTQAFVGLLCIPRAAHTQNVERIYHSAEGGKAFIAGI